MDQFLKKNWDRAKYFVIFFITIIGVFLFISIINKNTNTVTTVKNKADTLFEKTGF